MQNLLDFGLILTDLEKDLGGQPGEEHISGVLANESDRTYKSVQLVFNCYDINGLLIENTEASIGYLMPGDKWQIKSDQSNKTLSPEVETAKLAFVNVVELS